MADKVKSLPNVALEHRLNHLHYGTLGRISYNPADNDTQQVGRLQTNRAIVPKSYYNLLLEFTEVCPPSRTILPGVDSEPTKAVRGQTNWLLKTHPEAIVVGSDVASILPEEIAELKAATADGGGLSAPLAVGEITDHTDAMQIIARPALAMAAGEGGHILHIVTLDQEAEGWSDKGLSVQAIKVSRTQRGEWVEDGAPITNIKFAIDGKRYDPIRWIMVQKATGTTVFEPEIMLLPYQGNRSPREHIRALSTAPSHISAKRLFTIKTSVTGGRPHMDVSFNPVSDGRSPQLAVIDTSGEWSVFDITGSRSAKPKTLQPMLTARGSIEFGSIPSSLGSGPNNGIRKILWLALEDGSERAGLGFDTDDSSVDDSYHWGLYSRSPIRAKHVLVGSDIDVRLYDGSNGTQLTGIRLVRRAESVLDILSCPFSPSQVFVLTTDALFWLDVKLTEAGEARITVVLSCAHYKNRNADDKQLCFNVAPVPGPGPSKNCAVFVRSPQEKETNMFIFTNPTDDEAAHVAHQYIALDLPFDVRSTLISALPLFHFSKGAFAKRLAGDGQQPFPSDRARVFQLFGLGADLSLGSSMFTVSDASLKDLPSPKPLEEKKSSDDILRKKFLKHFGNSFVVPDGYTERSSTRDRSRERTLSLPQPEPDQEPANIRTVSLETAYARLKVLTANVEAPDQMDEGLVALLDRCVAEEVGDGDHLRLRTLSELLSSRMEAINLETLEDDLADFRESLTVHGGRAQITDLGGDKSSEDLQSLVRSLSALSFTTEDVPDAYRGRQQDLLRRVAIEQYLSRFGVSVSPPEVVDGLPAFNSQSQSQPRPRSSQLSQIDELPSSMPSSPPILPSSSRLQSSQPEQMDLDDATLPDPGPLARLRQYITIPETIISQPKPAPTRLVTHWQPGTDPWSYIWRGEDSRAALQEETEARRKKREEARRKRIEKRMNGLQLVDEVVSQPIPRIIQSSQIRGIQSSQMGGDSQSQSQRLPRISMSQVVPGPFGGRPVGGKKKKGKSGFR